VVDQTLALVSGHDPPARPISTFSVLAGGPMALFVGAPYLSALVGPWLTLLVL
jgi:hypothetical protein